MKMKSFRLRKVKEKENGNKNWNSMETWAIWIGEYMIEIERPFHLKCITMHTQIYYMKWGGRSRESGRFKSNEKKGLNRFSFLVIANLRHDFAKLTFKVLRVIQVKMVQLHYVYQFIKPFIFPPIFRFIWPSSSFPLLLLCYFLVVFHSKRKIIFHLFIWLPFGLRAYIQRQLTDGTQTNDAHIVIHDILLSDHKL